MTPPEEARTVLAVSRRPGEVMTYRLIPRSASTVAVTRRAPARASAVMRVGGSATRVSAQWSTMASVPGASRSSRIRARTPDSTISAAAAGATPGVTGSGAAASAGGRGRAPAGQPDLGVAQDGVGPFPVRTVMVSKQGHPDGHRVHPIGQQPAHEDQVPQRLGHLLAVVADHPGVHVHPPERV